MSFEVCITVDVEQDCPPFMSSYRGMEAGIGPLLDVLAEQDVRGTFFCTGDAAQRYPRVVRRIVDDGHELGCHGMTHARFTEMSKQQAEAEIMTSVEILRAYAPVVSFRAPYLSFPNKYLPLLEAAGFKNDSSQGAYKPASRLSGEGRTKMHRIRATIPPSVVRLPPPIRNPWLRMLTAPVVLFFHPWEFVDFREARELPLDCRFATGSAALRAVRETIELYRNRGASFKTIAQVCA